MTTARSAKAQATRNKILQAANDLFYQHGYNATGLDRIIARAGVAKGNFYHHFRSKEELAAAVLDWHREQAFAEIDLPQILDNPSPRQAVLDLAARMCARMHCPDGACRVRGCLFGNFALELAADSEPVRRTVDHVFQGIRTLLAELLEGARQAGEIRADLEPQATAGILLSLMEGAVLLDKAAQAEREVPNALAFMRAYLAP